ncbi:MAG TPA: phosphoribosyl-ATP diphosphatase [Planctomycetota bacterium]|nr:phosphoribosyl-ATP diphosphatase [Planctomycetota bacterium]
MPEPKRTPGTGAVLAAVFATVEERKATMPEKSYVAQLLRKGTDTICCKVAEEAGEVIKAAREQSREALIKELCDLYFHSMVLMTQKDITLAEVEAEFGKRHGISGLDEKAARKK